MAWLRVVVGWIVEGTILVGRAARLWPYRVMALSARRWAQVGEAATQAADDRDPRGGVAAVCVDGGLLEASAVGCVAQVDGALLGENECELWMPRAVLALLLLRANEVVASDRLVEELLELAAARAAGASRPPNPVRPRAGNSPSRIGVRLPSPAWGVSCEPADLACSWASARASRDRAVCPPTRGSSGVSGRLPPRQGLLIAQSGQQAAPIQSSGLLPLIVLPVSVTGEIVNSPPPWTVRPGLAASELCVTTVCSSVRCAGDPGGGTAPVQIPAPSVPTSYVA